MIGPDRVFLAGSYICELKTAQACAVMASALAVFFTLLVERDGQGVSFSSSRLIHTTLWHDRVVAPGCRCVCVCGLVWFLSFFQILLLINFFIILHIFNVSVLTPSFALPPCKCAATIATDYCHGVRARQTSSHPL